MVTISIMIAIIMIPASPICSALRAISGALTASSGYSLQGGAVGGGCSG